MGRHRTQRHRAQRRRTQRRRTQRRRTQRRRTQRRRTQRRRTQRRLRKKLRSRNAFMRGGSGFDPNELRLPGSEGSGSDPFSGPPLPDHTTTGPPTPEPAQLPPAGVPLEGQKLRTSTDPFSQSDIALTNKSVGSDQLLLDLDPLTNDAPRGAGTLTPEPAPFPKTYPKGWFCDRTGMWVDLSDPDPEKRIKILPPEYTMNATDPKFIVNTPAEAEKKWLELYPGKGTPQTLPAPNESMGLVKPTKPTPPGEGTPRTVPAAPRK